MTRPRLSVSLSASDDEQLRELRDDVEVPKRTRQRAEALRLSHRGWQTEQIAEYIGCQVETVRRTIHRWNQQGLEGLWDAPRGGRPPRWQESDFERVEARLSEPGTLNSRQVMALLETECQVKLSQRQVSRLLKKRGTAGSAPATATDTSRTPSSAPASKKP